MKAKKIVAIIGIIGAFASIISLIIILNTYEFIDEANIKIQGYEDRYLPPYDMDFKFPIVLENTGGEYAIVESITVLQLLSSGEYAHYTSDYEPYKPRIPTDSSVNVNITLPAHEA